MKIKRKELKEWIKEEKMFGFDSPSDITKYLMSTLKKALTLTMEDKVYLKKEIFSVAEEVVKENKIGV